MSKQPSQLLLVELAGEELRTDTDCFARGFAVGKGMRDQALRQPVGLERMGDAPMDPD